MWLVFFLFFVPPLRCIAQQQPPHILPLKIISNRPYIQTIIGSDTLQFMLDVAAVNVIERDLVLKLGLSGGAAYQQHGAGAGTSLAFETRCDSLRLGPYLFKNQTLVALPLREIKEGMKLPYLDGLIGYDLFRDRIIEINYTTATFRFLNRYDGNGTPIPFTLYRNQIPLITVSVLGTSARLIVDTGDHSALTFNRPFAISHRLNDRFDAKDTTLTGYGIGGPVRATTFILPRIAIGEENYEHVLSRIPIAETGGFSRSDFDGSIGGKLLLGKVLTIDYPNKTLYLESVQNTIKEKKAP